MNNITCGIAEDLLPLYIDGCCSKDSQQAVEDHMKTCKKCKEKYLHLQGNLPTIATEAAEIKTEEIALSLSKKIRKRKLVATVLTAMLVCPIVNTGIFLAGCYVFFLDGIKEIAQSLGFAGSVNLFIFTVLIGGNFIFEVLFNIILCPTITRIVDIGKKS